MDNHSKIKTVIDETSCGRHRVPIGIPCFHIPKFSGFGFNAGICNIRARKLFRGKISELSVQARRSKKEKK